MKAINVLEWIVNQSINGEYLNFVDIPQEGVHVGEQNNDWWMNMFGGIPNTRVEAGRYLYLFVTDMCSYDDACGFNPFDPDFYIELSGDENSMFDTEFINFFKMED